MTTNLSNNKTVFRNFDEPADRIVRTVPEISLKPILLLVLVTTLSVSCEQTADPTPLVADVVNNDTAPGAEPFTADSTRTDITTNPDLGGLDIDDAPNQPDDVVATPTDVPIEPWDMSEVKPDTTETTTDAPAAEPCPASCDDGDICTVDACHIANGCIHLLVSCADSDPCTHDVCDPKTGCSHQPYSCDDGNLCTTDYCLGDLECSNKPILCDDVDACTDDQCVDGNCENTPVSCDDNDPCTLDKCDKIKGCIPDPIGELCCLSDADCQKGDPCYVDTCVSGICQHLFQQVGDCCETSAGCNDENECTNDVCQTGHCVFQPLSTGGCCIAVTDCEDNNPCTEESCANAFCIHDYICCTSPSDCDDQNDCTQDFCLEEKCVHVGSQTPECCQEPIYDTFFEGAADGWILSGQTNGVGWHILTGGKAFEGSGTLYYGNPAQLNYSTSPAPNNGTAHSPPFVLPAGVKSSLEFALYLGVEAGTYADRLLVRVISKDDFGATTNTIIWTKKNFWTLNKWVPISLDLSAWNGRTVSVVLDFNTWDASKNETEGIYIDSFRVKSKCLPTACETDTACNDNLFTTLEHCTEGVCLYQLNPANCFEQPDCNDNNPCTSDVCGEYQCVHTDLKYCCNEDTDCVDTLLCTTGKCLKTAATPFCTQQWNYNCCEITPTGGVLGCEDGKPCTQDVCEVPGTPCLHKPIVDCCQKDEDCNDSEPCTVDICIDGGCIRPNLCCATDDDCNDQDELCTTETCDGGLCNYELINLPGCCKEEVLGESFDTGAATPKFGVVPPTSAGGGMWHPSTQQSLSPPLAMWFGNEESGNYATISGKASGSFQNTVDLRPPLLAFTELEFRLYLENEFSMGAYPNADFDRLKVTIVPLDLKKAPVGSPKTIWDSAWGSPVWWNVGENGTPSGAKWTAVSVDLTPYSGKLVQIRFLFDTIDAFNNDFGGPVIDDIVIRRTCGTMGSLE